MSRVVKPFGPPLLMEAPAKINLSLRVLARRPDGYHELESFMVKLALADRLWLTRTGRGISLACPGASLPENEDNLAWQAASRFFAATGARGGVAILLDKRIPIAAGLGGGSSDAAAVLLGLDRLFATRLARQTLLELAQSLGADVPFFVQEAVAAWARGIGERLTPAVTPALGWVVLVNPGFAVSTRWVFENLPLTSRGDMAILGRGLACPDGEQDIPLVNDLEQVTVERYPELARLKEALRAGGAGRVLMSGSGPTVFGLFADRLAAAACSRELAARYPGLVFVTRSR